MKRDRRTAVTDAAITYVVTDVATTYVVTDEAITIAVTYAAATPGLQAGGDGGSP